MATIHTKVGATWKEITSSFVKVSGVWKSLKGIYVKQDGVWKGVGTVTELNITSNTFNYDVFVEAGSPVAAVDVVINIASGIKVASTTTATPAMYGSANLPADSTVVINNLGKIQAKGGDANSGTGGIALQLIATTTLNNTGGDIWGGGGAGGYGGQGRANIAGAEEPVSFVYASGGAGGGGAGLNGGTGCGTSTETTGGPGCAGASNQGAIGGAGGAGGLPGQSGAAGSAGDFGAPSQGGSAGKAIDLNTFTLEWTGGNNATQVKGLVS